MIKWAPSRAGLSLLFLGLALMVLVFDRHTYKRYSGIEIGSSQKREVAAAGTTVQATIKELASKLEKPKVVVSHYAVTAEHNLFSPSRKAWQAPAPKPAPSEGKVEPKLEAAVPVRRDVVLYGTYISGKTRKAMLYFKRFRKGRMLVGEGEEAQDNESSNPPRNNPPTYTVLKVEARQVTLKDERGNEFTVNLYDNKRRRLVKTVNRKMIKIDTASAPQKSAKITTSAVGISAPKATSGKKSGATTLTSRQIRKLSVEEKEALITKGVLKKYSTPFGPIYKRLRK